MSRFAGMLSAGLQPGALKDDVTTPTQQVSAERSIAGAEVQPESTPIVKRGPFQMKYNKSSFPFKGSPAKDMKTGKYKQEFEN